MMRLLLSALLSTSLGCGEVVDRAPPDEGVGDGSGPSWGPDAVPASSTEDDARADGGRPPRDAWLGAADGVVSRDGGRIGAPEAGLDSPDADPLPPPIEPCEDCSTCPNEECEAAEDCATCPQDCGACPSECGDGVCAADEDCEGCPADCRACDTCPDGACGPGEDCAVCAADCGACPPDCGGAPCPAGQACLNVAHQPGPFCSACDPEACNAFGVVCCPHNAASGDCTSIWNDPLHCGSCGRACNPGERCVTQFEPVLVGPFCTTCDPEACGALGVRCCPGSTPGECTNTLTDASNCGACQVRCDADEICNMGRCQAANAVYACNFDPMQWWADPQGRSARDVTFVAFADAHAADPEGHADCDRAARYDDTQNFKMRRALSALLPSIFWPAHDWPAGSGLHRAGRAFDHVRGAIVAGDLTQNGDQPEPGRARRCREYRVFRDAYGRCGSEGRLPFPVYDGYGNHEFPRQAGLPDPDVHPVVDNLDRLTAAHRPGAAGDKYDDPRGGTGHYAWRWDDIWFVQLNLKPGFHNIDLADGRREADPHQARSFLKAFLRSRANSRTRQLVIVAHYALDQGHVEQAERDGLCQMLYNASRGEGDFAGQPKLSPDYPVVAYLHGHDHQRAHGPVEVNCGAAYGGIRIPQYDLGTPMYRLDSHGGRLMFTVFRLGNRQVEAAGFAVPHADPTGPWQVLYTHRHGVLLDP